MEHAGGFSIVWYCERDFKWYCAGPNTVSHYLWIASLRAVRYCREIKELREALEKEKREAEEARKALQDKITEEKVRNGEMDPDEVGRPSLRVSGVAEQSRRGPRVAIHGIWSTAKTREPAVAMM